MDKDATQSGADSDQHAPAHAARSAAMEQIARGVNESYEQDLAKFDEDSGEVETKQQETPVVEETQAAEPETAPVVDDLETLVVEGREVKVKRDQVLDAGRRALQKESAADKRLQEATDTLNRARAYERSLSTQPSSDAGNDNQSPSSDATNSRGATQATREETVALVRQELWLDSADKAAMRFKDEFKDLVDDPYAARLVAQLENERLEQAAYEGRPLGDPWQAYKAHGDKVREWMGKSKAGQTPISADRQERKRDMTVVTGASTRLQPAAPKKPPTTSEIIEAQRLARRGKQLPTAR